MNRSQLANELLKTPSFNENGKPPEILILDSSGEYLDVTAVAYDSEVEGGAIFLKVRQHE